MLTAAYCVSPTAFNINPEVWCGDIQDINNSSRGAVDVLRAVKTTLHECYDPRRYFNDIAVLELNASIVHGKPIGNIITVAEFESLQPRDQLVGLGWGRTTNDSTTTTATAAAGFPKSLQQAVLPFISDQACNTPESYNNTVDSDLMFCAGYFDGRADACAGDSGGPLVQHAVSRKKNHSDNNSRKMNNPGDTLVGIVSWGEGCGVKGHPGVYARVDVHHDWIVLHSHCACSTIERFNYTRGPGNNSSECILIEESGEVAVEHKADISAAAGSSTATPTATGQPPGLCYVVNFEKCPLATASRVFPGKGWLPCRKNSQGEVETIHNATSCSFRGGP